MKDKKENRESYVLIKYSYPSDTRTKMAQMYKLLDQHLFHRDFKLGI